MTHQRTHDLTQVLDFRVASILLHANEMWRDLREFYNLVGFFEKYLKIKNMQTTTVTKTLSF